MCAAFGCIDPPLVVTFLWTVKEVGPFLSVWRDVAAGEITAVSRTDLRVWEFRDGLYEVSATILGEALWVTSLCTVKDVGPYLSV